MTIRRYTYEQGPGRWKKECYIQPPMLDSGLASDVVSFLGFLELGLQELCKPHLLSRLHWINFMLSAWESYE